MKPEVLLAGFKAGLVCYSYRLCRNAHHIELHKRLPNLTYLYKVAADPWHCQFPCQLSSIFWISL